MKALVAGGAGFIGSNLVDALLAEGHQVVCVDNFAIGTRANIAHLRDCPGFTFYESDLCDGDSLNSIFAKEAPEYVFHMAANSDIQASAENPRIEYQNTYTTTFHLLESMRRYRIHRLFFCSTSAVYGDALGADVDENYTPLQPISYYGACKLGCEALISAYSYMNDIRTLVFRFPNVIGQRLTHGVVYDFIRKLRNNPRELTILGDGCQRKPYLHVDDLVSCIMRFKEEVSLGVTLYNVGDHTQSTVTGIADIVCTKMGLRGVAYRYTGGKGGWKGDVPVFSYNLDRIHAAGWKATMSSDEAVAKAIESELK